MPTLTDILDPAPHMRIGLLGGSFNPAHAGHVHISEFALQKLGLHEIWWLVSPQNPLKAAEGMAPLEERLQTARRVADGHAVRVTDIERDLGTRYTADTLAALTRRFRDVHFVWIMGADLLLEIPRWRRWQTIFRTVPIAVFGRPPYSFRAQVGRAARRFAQVRVRESRARSLPTRTPPAWVFLNTPPNAVSATRIRAGLALGRTGD